MKSHEPLVSSIRNGADWLLAAFARRHRASPDTPASEILERLADTCIVFGEGVDLPDLAEQTEQAPYVLETLVYLLRRKGVWPGDPKVALLCYEEILSTIVDAAPAYGVPWEATAEAADAG